MGDLEPLPVQTPAKLNDASRKQQLAEWASSETAKIDPSLKNKNWSVKFPPELMFLSACENGDVEYAQELLEMGVDINAKNSDGLAALHQATVNTDEDMLNFLIDNGADLDIFDNEGWTPLHAAASVGSLNFVSILIEKGANPVAVNHDGDTPYDLVKGDTNEEVSDVAQYLLQIIDQRGIDLEACKHAEENQMREDSLRWLAERDREAVNRQHPDTRATPLHVAASKNFIDIMRNLLRAGADPNMQDKDDWTPLHAAAHWSLYDAAKLLTEYGANFNVQNRNKHTPKDLAESDMLARMNELEAQQTNLIEARKCNMDENSDSLPLAHSISSARRRSSVCRASVVDKESLIKMKDKELEKMEIRLRAEEHGAKLSPVPPTPGTPSQEGDLSVQNRQRATALTMGDPSRETTEGDQRVSSPALSDKANSGSFEDMRLPGDPTRVVSPVAVMTSAAETASVTSEGDEDDVTSSASVSSRHSIESGRTDTTPVCKPEADKAEKAAAVPSKRNLPPKTDAMQELMRELEQDRGNEEEHEKRPKKLAPGVPLVSRPLSGIYDDSGAADYPSPMPTRRKNSLVRQRIERIEKTPLKATTIKNGAPAPSFNRASVTSTDPVTVSSQPAKLIYSRKLKEPPPPVVSEPVPPEEASLPPVRIVEEKDREPQVVPVRGDTSPKDHEERHKESSPTTAPAKADNKVHTAPKEAAPAVDSNPNLLSEQSATAALSEKTDSESKEKESTEDLSADPSPFKRGASWRVRKPRKAADSQNQAESSKPEPESDAKAEGETPVKKEEAEQTTPNTMLLPKNDEKEITRKQRARFERHTRRSTQGISVADLEEALASPHHHPIREDKKEVRERIESKFIGTSPALASPVERGISSSVSPKPSREETTTNAGSVENPVEGVSAAGSSFGTPQGPVHSQPVASSNEGFFSVSARIKSWDASNMTPVASSSTGTDTQSRSPQSWNKKAPSALEDTPPTSGSASVPSRVPVNGLFSPSTSPYHSDQQQQPRDLTEPAAADSFNFNSSSRGRGAVPSTPVTPRQHKSSYARSDSGVGSVVHTPGSPACPKEPPSPSLYPHTSAPAVSHTAEENSVNQNKVPQQDDKLRPSSLSKCHHRIEQLEAEVDSLKNELALFHSNARWQQVQQEKQERMQLTERLSQLESQLSEHEALAKNYAKVRAENASLIRLLANFARKEYDIPPASSRRTGSGGTAAGLGVGVGVGASCPRVGSGDRDSRDSLSSVASSNSSSHGLHYSHSVSLPPSSVTTPRNSFGDFSNSSSNERLGHHPNAKR